MKRLTFISFSILTISLLSLFNSCNNKITPEDVDLYNTVEIINEQLTEKTQIEKNSFIYRAYRTGDDSKYSPYVKILKVVDSAFLKTNSIILGIDSTHSANFPKDSITKSFDELKKTITDAISKKDERGKTVFLTSSIKSIINLVEKKELELKKVINSNLSSKYKINLCKMLLLKIEDNVSTLCISSCNSYSSLFDMTHIRTIPYSDSTIGNTHIKLKEKYTSFVCYYELESGSTRASEMTINTVPDIEMKWVKCNGELITDTIWEVDEHFYKARLVFSPLKKGKYEFLALDKKEITTYGEAKLRPYPLPIKGTFTVE